jgi:hypothetical protein
MQKFTDWITNKVFKEEWEFKDIFGFEAEYPQFDKKEDNGKPIKRLDSSLVLDELARSPLGIKQPSHIWHDMIEWGHGNNGDIKVVVSPLGSYKATIRKRQMDLEGNTIWICKKIIPLNDMSFPDQPVAKPNKSESVISNEIYENLLKIDKELINASSHDFELEDLVVEVAQKVKIYAPQIFVFNGCRKLDENNYIIYLGYRGQGVEAPGSRRVEQFDINMNFNSKKGIIRTWGCEISSPTKGHKWESRPAEWNEVFATSQSKEEISESIINALMTY